jgi:hypothetical protein
MAHYSCTSEMHRVCVNNALCHLCDGKRLFKDPKADRKAKEEAKQEKKAEQKSALLRTYSKEKKEGMGFEKRVQKEWNQTMGRPSSGDTSPNGKKVGQGKPRIDVGSVPNGRGKPNPALGEARRQPNSGATWKAKGDIKLYHALMECKERGTLTAKGEKQIAIMKEWLDKMVIEAYKEARDYWYLPFGFKGSDDIYIVKPFDHEMQLIYELRVARERIEELEELLGGRDNGGNE